MELLIVIAIIWLYMKWIKSDPQTRERYKEKATETYNRLLIEAQKAQSAADKTKQRPSDDSPLSYQKPINTGPDGPTVTRPKRLFGLNIDG